MEIKTDNSCFQEKLWLREQAVSQLDRASILECFAGESLLWKAVERKHPEKELTIVRLDKNPKVQGTLKGDNIKYLYGLNLNEFDIVDLDAYGVPFAQLEVLFQLQYHGLVIITVIQSGYGRLPYYMLKLLGYSRKMIEKSPTLFHSNGLSKFMEYLAVREVPELTYFLRERKLYGSFLM